MKTARQALLEYLDAFPIPAKAAALFAPDGALEIPYLESVNLCPRSVGPKAIEKFISTLVAMIPDWKFSDLVICMEEERQVIAEYEVHAMTSHTQRMYDQHFFGRLVLDGEGRILLLREALDLVKASQALFKNGLNDIPII